MLLVPTLPERFNLLLSLSSFFFLWFVSKISCLKTVNSIILFSLGLYLLKSSSYVERKLFLYIFEDYLSLGISLMKIAQKGFYAISRKLSRAHKNSTVLNQCTQTFHLNYQWLHCNVFPLSPLNRVINPKLLGQLPQKKEKCECNKLIWQACRWGRPNDLTQRITRPWVT